jgi:hypothetical protein
MERKERVDRPEWLGARIEIGGRVTEAQLEEIRFRGGGQPDCEERERLVIEDQLAPWGEFPHLEPYLREQGIPYDRWSSHYEGIQPVLVRWRPGMEEALAVPASHDLTDTVVPYEKIRLWVGAWHDGACSLLEMVQSLTRSAGGHLDPLPPFTVGEPPIEAEPEAPESELDPTVIDLFEDGSE